MASYQNHRAYLPCHATVDTVICFQWGGSQGGAELFQGVQSWKTPIFCCFWQLLRYHCPDAPGCRKHRELSLTDFCDGIMYSKIKQENWATLLKITPQKVPKIKSVAQFNKRIRFHMQRTEPDPHSSSRRNTAKRIAIWPYAMSIKPRDRADLTNQKSCV